MKKITMLMATLMVVAVIGLGVLPTSVVAGGPITAAATGYYDDSLAPVVPIKVFVKGRQVVVDYLSLTIDHVVIKYDGRSLAQPEVCWLGADTLKRMGYVHRGSFSELSDAMASLVFSQQVVKTSGGYYDVGAVLDYYSIDKKKPFRGSGYLDISRNPEGGLTARQLEPWVWLNENITAESSSNINAARYVEGYVNPRNLPVGFDDQNQKWTVSVQSWMLDTGYLLLADQNGNVTGWDLATRSSLAAQRVVTLLGQTHFQDVRVLRNPETIDAGDTEFYSSGGEYYGNFPLIDLTTDKAMAKTIRINVPVWGTSITVKPTQVFITPLYMNGPGAMTVGVESELPRVLNPTTGEVEGFFLIIPAGGYHIRVDITGVRPGGMG